MGFLEKEFNMYKGRGLCLSVAFIDIDDFKNINDSYGHYSGDKVIEKIGELSIII